MNKCEHKNSDYTNRSLGDRTHFQFNFSSCERNIRLIPTKTYVWAVTLLKNLDCSISITFFELSKDW